MAEGSRFQISRDDAAAILGAPRTEEISLVCNVDPRDHVHVARVGAEGAALGGRGLVLVHEGDSLTRVFLAAPELRRLAAGLLNVADDLDSKTRLNFLPEQMPETEDPNEKETDTE